jgi:hypothetical protein
VDMGNYYALFDTNGIDSRIWSADVTGILSVIACGC